MLLKRGAGPFEAVTGRQRLGRDLTHAGECRAGSDAGRRTAVNCHRAIVVVAGDDLRTCHDAKGGDRLQRHHGALAVADVDLPQIRHIASIDRFALQVDLPGPAEQIEVVDEVAAERGLECGEDIIDRESQGLGLLAVDVEIKGPGGRPVGREHAGKMAILISGADESLGDASQGGRIGALEALSS